ncbi:MAG: SDR family oxidoreductase [Acidobacteria bacterium]|nr:SDR family oxidoreductase [Acidobacteriota bacterium]MCB9397475.1 SDR family oxidoreductase [Acidobacteriota bacterium]
MSSLWLSGASGGLGRAIAQLFVDKGFEVIGIDQLSCEAFPGRLVICDLTDYGQLKTKMQEFAVPDVLIHCAGITRDKVSWKMEPDLWKQVIDLNLNAGFYLSSLVASGMKNRQSGVIIHISSINASRGKFGQSNYVASKAGLEGLVRNLAIELGAYGVRANAVAPGLVETTMTQNLPQEVLIRAQNERLLPYPPTPHDVAELCWFLASPQARCLTGQVFCVDSGQLLGGS